jgi:Putative prokaryotic signal transducing protein
MAIIDPESERQRLAWETGNLIVIRRFRDLPEALLAKGSLESSGIKSFLLDDNTVRMDWLWSNLLGGVKVLVDTNDAETAKEILSQPTSEELELESAEVYRQPHCPNCQSLDVNFQELYKPIAFGSLFVNFPLPVHRRGWTCHSCRHDWWEEAPGGTGEINSPPG